jgi:uncharacterized Fe-S cluster-containing radical SAM superfamily protein
LIERVLPEKADLFILETNGILIGHDESYARELSRFKNLYVRVSLKGTAEEEFSRLTGCSPEGFGLQIKAVENLYQAGVEVQPAVMVSFSSAEGIEAYRKGHGKVKSLQEYHADILRGSSVR